MINLFLIAFWLVGSFIILINLYEYLLYNDNYRYKYLLLNTKTKYTVWLEIIIISILGSWILIIISQMSKQFIRRK